MAKLLTFEATMNFDNSATPIQFFAVQNICTSPKIIFYICSDSVKMQSKLMEQTKTLGRPTDYNTAIAELLCERLSTGKIGLERICSEEGMPGASTVWRWIAKHADFREMYALARGYQSEVMYDDLLTIPNMPLTHNGEANGIPLEGAAAMAEISRRKLVCDNLKFILAKLQPKRFGERKDINLDVNVRKQVSGEQFDQLLSAAREAPRIEQETEEVEYEMLTEATEPEDTTTDRKQDEEDNPDWL